MTATARLILIVILATACSGSNSSRLNLINDYPSFSVDGNINAVIEIPAGSVEKWEVDKTDGKLKWEMVNDQPRIIDYIGYPGNYGFIPQTLLDKASGGDGDPLDVIILGPPEERGSVVICKLLGILYLTDRGEQDDKLIAVSEKSSLYKLNSLEELGTAYPGIKEIIQLWFTGYKGPGFMSSTGFGSKTQAVEVLEYAINQYRNKN